MNSHKGWRPVVHALTSLSLLKQRLPVKLYDHLQGKQSATQNFLKYLCLVTVSQTAVVVFVIYRPLCVRNLVSVQKTE